MAIWQTKTKSPIFHLANIFYTRLTQNLAHDLSVAVVQIEQSLVKYLASMSSAFNVASNSFEQRTHVHIVTMVMLNTSNEKDDQATNHRICHSKISKLHTQKSDSDTKNQL